MSAAAPPPTSAPGGPGSDTPGWIVLGSGAAVGAAGVVVKLMANSKVAGIDEGMTEVDAHAEQDAAETLNLVGSSLAGAGGAAVFTGLAFLIFGADGTDETAQITPWTNGSGASLGVSF